MKTKQFLLTGAIGLAFAGLIITGCKKTETSTDTDTGAAQDEASATFAINESKGIADGAAQGQATERSFHGSTTAEISGRDTTVGSQTDTLIDIYFPGKMASPDGRLRDGHIIVFWEKGHGYWDSAGTVNMTWYNYTVNGMGISGLRTLTNLGHDSAGIEDWSINANLSFTFPGGKTATWNATRTHTRTKIGGNWYYIVNGTASGVSRSGVNYTLTITNPLYVDAIPEWKVGGCDWPEAGEVEITRTGKKYPLYLTYTAGVGNCSNQALATINGNTFNVTLP